MKRRDEMRIESYRERAVRSRRRRERENFRARGGEIYLRKEEV